MAESEADTPIEFDSKYFEFEGVRLPPFCRGKMEQIAAFSLRSSDIWIVTYPKSGKQRARRRACGAALIDRKCGAARALRPPGGLSGDRGACAAEARPRRASAKPQEEQ